MAAGRPKGLPKTGGASRKGKPNKKTAELKEMILGALDDAGGREYLTKQATANPGAFLTLVGKILPTQMNTKSEVTLKTRRSKEETDALIRELRGDETGDL